MKARSKIPLEQCIERALENLALGSADGLNLAKLMLEEGELFFPLIQIIKQCWKNLMNDKKNFTLCDQVEAYRLSGVGYLKERMHELALQVVPPPTNPWTEIAVRPNTEQGESLRLVGERLRGTLATVAGVLAPKTHDPEVLRQAGEIVAELLDQGQAKEMAMLRSELEALPLKELYEDLQIKLGNLLMGLEDRLARGLAGQSSAVLESTRKMLSTAGRQVRWKVIEAYGIKPNHHRKCPACKAPYVTREKVDCIIFYPGSKLNYICQVCGKTFD